MSYWNYDELIPLKEKPPQSYQPNEQDMVQYAEYLGLEQEDLQQKEIFKLVLEGIQAQLPPEWQACSTGTSMDEILYRNIITRQITEHHPVDAIYREKAQKLKAQLLSMNSQDASSSEMSVVQQELFEIAQDQNQLKNQSELYERNRYGNPHVASKDQLREALTSEHFKRILEVQNYSVGANSMLDQRITSQKGKENTSQEQNTNKMLPSSLLLPVHSTNQPHLEQYRTVITNLDNDSLNQTSKSEQYNLKKQVQNLKAQLQEMQAQQQMKQALLQQLQESNREKAQKIRRKLKKRKHK